VSPEVGVDGKVTFRLYAPEAKKVTVDTEGAEAIPGITNDEVMETTKNVPFTRTENGIWSITLGHFPPGVNRYSYKVDGLTLADPKSIGTCVDRNLLLSIGTCFLRQIMCQDFDMLSRCNRHKMLCLP
jgi:1,4-alpha-glucan branching enzyme